MTGKRPISLSIDLDDKWVYLKVRALEAWRARPSYYPVFVPRVLEFLRRRSLRATFFVVGEDAEDEARSPFLRAIAEAGHEIANHSFSHETWMDVSDIRALGQEVSRAEAAIELATGKKPLGFRGPGFVCSDPLLRVLRQRGYEYDASLFPTSIAPLARLYYLATSHMSREEKQRRRGLFGPARAAFWPLRAFEWDLGAGGRLVEIPVTTLPCFRFPIHAAYIMALAQRSPFAAELYARFALRLCRAARVAPSLLLHPLDFLTVEDAPELAFFPGMKMPMEVKDRILESMFDAIVRDFNPLTMLDHARLVSGGGSGAVRSPRILG